MNWNIRRMNTSDIDKVYAIETSVHIAPWSRNILRDCVLVGYNCMVLETTIDKDWVLGGYIICRHNNHCCHILNFCIARHLQSKGYGRKFLQCLIDSLEHSREIDQVMLEVRPSNHIALHLYQSMGFEQAEIKQDYYKDENKVEDAFLLKKLLRF